MSNLRHVAGNDSRRQEERGERRVHPLLFVVVLLMGIAGVLWFVASRSGSGGVTTEPATQAVPGQPAAK